MTDKESYVNVADLKRKLRAFAKYRQYSKSATDELLGVVSKLKVSIKADLETTLESTDVQPVKHGRWESPVSVGNGIKFCSVCRNEAYWDTDYGQQLFDYCPYCGARMDLKDGDTDA